MPEECARDCWVMRSCGADGPKLTLAKTHNLIRSSDWQGLHNPGNTPTSNYPGMDATRRTHRNQCSLHRQNSLICGSMWCQLSSAITHDSRRNGELKGAVSLGSSMATGSSGLELRLSGGASWASQASQASQSRLLAPRWDARFRIGERRPSDLPASSSDIAPSCSAQAEGDSKAPRFRRQGVAR